MITRDTFLSHDDTDHFQLEHDARGASLCSSSCLSLLTLVSGKWRLYSFVELILRTGK